MKSCLFSFLLLLMLNTSFGQIANDHTFSVEINGKDFVAQPRRIRIGPHWWITANAIKPDKSLRIWLYNWNRDKDDLIIPGI